MARGVDSNVKSCKPTAFPVLLFVMISGRRREPRVDGSKFEVTAWVDGVCTNSPHDVLDECGSWNNWVGVVGFDVEKLSKNLFSQTRKVA